MLVHSDTIQVKLDGQGHGSKFTVTGGNVAAVIIVIIIIIIIIIIITGIFKVA